MKKLNRQPKVHYNGRINVFERFEIIVEVGCRLSSNYFLTN